MSQSVSRPPGCVWGADCGADRDWGADCTADCETGAGGVCAPNATAQAISVTRRSPIDIALLSIYHARGAQGAPACRVPNRVNAWVLNHGVETTRHATLRTTAAMRCTEASQRAKQASARLPTRHARVRAPQWIQQSPGATKLSVGHGVCCNITSGDEKRDRF